MGFAEMMAKKTLAEAKVRIVLDQGWADSLDKAREVARLARRDATGRGDDPDADEAVQEADADVEALVAQADEATTEFVFRSISRQDFQVLLDLHPPTRDQRKETPGVGWNEDTFPQALIALTVVSPPMSEADVKELWNHPAWSPSELTLLYQTAQNCVARVREVNLKLGVDR